MNEQEVPNIKEISQKKKKKIISYVLKYVVFAIFGGIAVAGGFIVGDLLIGRFDTFDPSKYSADSYKESENNIIAWKSKKINELDATQVFVVAEQKILENEHYQIKTKGWGDDEEQGYVLTMGMSQSLYGNRYRNGDEGYFDYFSMGAAAKVIKKTEFRFSEQKFFTYEGSLDGNDVNWTLSKPESGQDYRTRDEYKQMVGCYAENPIDYIVSTKTVVEQTSNGKVGDNYSYTLKLNISTSVLNYVVKMKYMSGFDYPKFLNIELRFEVDENMNFQNIYVNESYRVIGMKAESKYKMEFTYSK